MENPLSPQHLAEIISQFRGKYEEEEDKSKYRYAIYCRKSTDDPKRQTRSLPDQLAECEELAQARGLHIVKRIRESESAKAPGIRPKFKEMLDDLRQGKYEGVIAWHPDRLSRNMREAGEIIDMIDSHIVKDLHFVGFHFENNPTGKMTLGITFVLSKHYSDQLSANVNRGNKRSSMAGKYVHRFIHGYYKDTNQQLRPDGENYHLIKAAWKMRKEKKTLDQIAEWLNSHGYQRADGIGGVKHITVKMDKAELSSKVFREPLYAGVLQYGSNPAVDLTEVYDFMPMVTVEEFFEVTELDHLAKAFRQKFRGNAPGSIKADLLRDMVYCSSCNETLNTGITSKDLKSGEKKHYFYYRCETPGCERQNKSTRAKIVSDFVISYLEKNSFASEEMYERYVRDANKSLEENEKALDGQRRSVQQRIKLHHTKIDQSKQVIREEKEDKEVRQMFIADVKRYEEELKTMEKDLVTISEAVESNKQAIIEYPQFLELINSLPDILRNNRDLETQDTIIKNIFSNFTVTGKEVVAFELAEPYKGFVESKQVVDGRGTQTRTGDLLVPNQAH